MATKTPKKHRVRPVKAPLADTVEAAANMLRTLPKGTTVELDYGSVNDLKEGTFRLRLWFQTGEEGSGEVTIEHKV